MSNLVNVSAPQPKSAGSARSPHPGQPPFANVVWVPGGTFRMGSDRHYPEEAPAHDVTVDGFWMDRYAVTKEQFHRFVDAIGYVTSAERPPDPVETRVPSWNCSCPPPPSSRNPATAST
jgi:formylglycine-generating enzyme required for sulfatase activity